jgi:hypothetical protein
MQIGSLAELLAFMFSASTVDEAARFEISKAVCWFAQLLVPHPPPVTLVARYTPLWKKPEVALATRVYVLLKLSVNPV